MTDEVDITAPNLPKVEERKQAGADGTLETTEPRHLAGAEPVPEVTDTSPPIRARLAPAITADQQSEPSLPKVAETASVLEPVPEPATTLDLDDEAEALAVREQQARDKKAAKVELKPDPATQPVATRQRRAVPRALGGDGFEGASLEQLPAVKPAESPAATVIDFLRQSAFWIGMAFVAAVLIALGAWFFS